MTFLILTHLCYGSQKTDFLWRFCYGSQKTILYGEKRLKFLSKIKIRFFSKIDIFLWFFHRSFTKSRRTAKKPTVLSSFSIVVQPNQGVQLFLLFPS